MTAIATRNGTSSGTDVAELLGPEADSLLNHKARRFPRRRCTCPARISSTAWCRQPTARRACCGTSSCMLNTGRLAGTGYVSILPVDQGIEHSAGASFAPNPQYFDPENIVKLAIEGGCNAVASTLGVLGAVARKYAHKIPFLVKLNHNELLTYPNQSDQIMFAQRQAGVRHGRGRGRRDDLLRLGRIRPADPGGLARPSPRPTSWAW